MDISKVKFMSLGSNCLSLAVLGYGIGKKISSYDIRIKGPVDNIWSKGIQNAVDLVDGTFKKSIISGPIDIKNRNPSFKGDSDKEYIFNNFSIVHNEYNDNFIEKILQRIIDFEMFFESSKYDTNKMFIYTISQFDTSCGIPKKPFLDGLDRLKNLMDINKVIFIGNRKVLNKYTPFEWYLDRNIASSLGIKYIELHDAGIRFDNDVLLANNLFISQLCDLPKKKISVVMPVYNSAKFISKTIENVLVSLTLQSSLDWELLLIDDGSKDDSVDICRKYSYSNVRIIKTGLNQGAGPARNTGIEFATGEYITFIDSDDLINTQYFSEIADAISIYSNDFDIIYTNCITRDNKNGVEKDYSNDRYAIKDFIPLGLTRIICKSDLLKNNNVKFLGGNLFEGESFCLQYYNACNNKKVLLLKNAYYKIIDREGSITSSKKPMNMQKSLETKRQLENLYIKANNLNYTQESKDIIQNFIKRINNHINI